MHRTSTLAVAVATAALALGALALPVTGADKPLLTAVNGMPGKKVDVCIGTNEIRSSLRYGGYVQKRQPAGTKNVRFRQASPGKCKGTLLAARPVSLPGGSDKTVVATAKAPQKVLVFDNTSISSVPVPGADPEGWFAERHAADLGDATFKFTMWNLLYEDVPVGPAADPVYSKGMSHQHESFLDGEFLLEIRVTRPNQSTVLARTPTLRLEPNQRRESILVGSTAGNAKIVSIATDLAPAP